jgi:hypothetical protein
MERVSKRTVKEKLLDSLCQRRGIWGVAGSSDQRGLPISPLCQRESVANSHPSSGYYSEVYSQIAHKRLFKGTSSTIGSDSQMNPEKVTHGQNLKGFERSQNWERSDSRSDHRPLNIKTTDVRVSFCTFFGSYHGSLSVNPKNSAGLSPEVCEWLL